MMELKEVSLNLGMKISENYNSVSADVGATVKISKDDAPEEAIEKLRKFVRQELKNEILTSLKVLRAQNLLG